MGGSHLLVVYVPCNFHTYYEPLTAYSFLVKGYNMGTKNLARLYVGVSKADKIGQNGGGGGSHLLVLYVPCNFHTYSRILLRVLQSQKLNYHYLGLQRSLILYLTVYFKTHSLCSNGLTSWTFPC